MKKTLLAGLLLFSVAISAQVKAAQPRTSIDAYIGRSCSYEAINSQQNFISCNEYECAERKVYQHAILMVEAKAELYNNGQTSEGVRVKVLGNRSTNDPYDAKIDSTIFTTQEHLIRNCTVLIGL